MVCSMSTTEITGLQPPNSLGKVMMSMNINVGIEPYILDHWDFEGIRFIPEGV